MKLYASLSDDLAEWAQRQPVFFTASAPTHGPHINVSPKGLSAHFAVLSPNQVAYIDRTGSGCETISHAYENARLTLMFMSFGPAPRILRLFCRSTVVEYDSPRFQDLIGRVAGGQREAFDGARAVIVGDVWQVQTSCGFGVPMVRKQLYADGDTAETQPLGERELSVFSERPTLDEWARKSIDDNRTRSYQMEKNSRSLDELPGLRIARRDAGEWILVGDAVAWFRRLRAEKSAVAFGFFLAVLVYFFSSVVRPLVPASSSILS